MAVLSYEPVRARRPSTLSATEATQAGLPWVARIGSPSWRAQRMAVLSYEPVRARRPSTLSATVGVPLEVAELTPVVEVPEDGRLVIRAGQGAPPVDAQRHRVDRGVPLECA